VPVAVIAAGAYVAGLALGAPSLRLVTKPVPVLCLAALVFFTGGGSTRRPITAGLLLSAAGDVLLEQPAGFLPGLVAFLLAHVAYAIAFLSDERRLRLARAAPFAAWLVTAFVWLRPGLGSMQAPVAVYMFAIGAMMWRAAARVNGGEGDRPGAAAALAGAVLFGLSDTLIAVDRFRAPIPGASYAIILLYWAGQAGIASAAAPSHRRWW
jgi:alkenylglycerophosphocholine/alkenylglycerophosphoethanolamine hydrolase